jgi:geranylgeranyl diphosphate synthase, type II
LKHLQDLIEKGIASFCQELPSQPENLYSPVSYTLSLGGKRIRPLLALLSNEMFGGNPVEALPAALAIEVFHNFTLLHDDIMDNAPLRRNKESVHAKWNSNVAILSGDAMLVKSYELLSKIKSPILSQILPVFNKAALEVCEGQQYDMAYEQGDFISIKEYLNMIELKTAVLLAASLEIGARIANANPANAQHVYEFGKNIGIAFQLQDDLLDAFGKQEKVGKRIGGDIVSNKKTFLLLKAFELANASQKIAIKSLLSSQQINPENKIKEMLSIFNDLSIRELTEEKMNYFFDQGLGNMQKIKLGDERKTNLISIAKSLMVREN